MEGSIPNYERWLWETDRVLPPPKPAPMPAFTLPPLPMPLLPPLPVLEPSYELERLITLDHYNWICQYCLGFGDQADHIIPKSKGGPDWSWNLVAACAECNRAASDVFLLSFEEKWLYVRARRNLW